MENLIIGKFTFTISTRDINGKSWFIARVDKATPRGKYRKSKCVYNYRFSKETDRDIWVERVSAQMRDEITAKAERAQAKKNLVNPYKVGDLFYDSWGYDQTNIDFYQVVRVTQKSCVVRPIGKVRIEETGWLSYRVRPRKDHFTGDEQTKRVNTFAGSAGPWLGSGYHSMAPWDRESITETHYA